MSRAFIQLFLMTLIIGLFSCGQKTDTGGAAKYLGMVPPGLTPEVFLPDIVSSKEYFEFSNTVSPDGKEFYFARQIEQKEAVYITRRENNVWSEPEKVESINKYNGFEPCISNDGTKMYITRFARPPNGVVQDENTTPRDMEAQMVNIWVMDRIENGWGEPQFCVNGMYVTTAINGTIYTTDIREATEGACRYRLIDGKYGERESLGGGVNSPFPGAHPCIAADESFIVFDSKRDESGENADLFVCFRQQDGTWSEAIDFGSDINTPTDEICAMLTPDGKYMFYQSRGDIYWVSTEILENLKLEYFR